MNWILTAIFYRSYWFTGKGFSQSLCWLEVCTMPFFVGGSARSIFTFVVVVSVARYCFNKWWLRGDCWLLIKQINTFYVYVNLMLHILDILESQERSMKADLCDCTTANKSSVRSPSGILPHGGMLQLQKRHSSLLGKTKKLKRPELYQLAKVALAAHTMHVSVEWTLSGLKFMLLLLQASTNESTVDNISMLIRAYRKAT